MHPLLIEIKREHGNYRIVLEHLERQVELLESDPVTAVEHIGLVLEYLREQPEVTHHVNEELIQRQLERDSELPRELVDVRRDHGAFDGILEQLQQTVRQHPHSRRLTSDLLACVDRYRRHLRYEEEYLLPQADSLLGADSWTEIEAQWVSRQDPVFGARRSQRYELLIRAMLSP